MRKYKSLIIGLITTMVVLSISGSALAAATTKNLSTNFTLVNLGTATANVVVNYIKSNGDAWAAASEYSSFSISADGGQQIVRQYDAASGMSAGEGSVYVSSSAPLGAVVQILARGQTPSSGAYNGVSEGSPRIYLPLLQKGNVSASGVVNSQIIIQNLDTSALNVTITFTQNNGTVRTKQITGLAPNVSSYVDLTNESALTSPWVGSAVVSADNGTGKLAAVSNMFLGADGLMTYNGFPDAQKYKEWFLPLITSRLSNGQSASVAVQNVSGGELQVGDLELTCTKDANSQGAATFTTTSTTKVADQNSYYFNPVVDTTNFPTNWYGSCRVKSLSDSNIVAFAQIRYTNGVADAAAYEGIPANSTAKTLYVPLVIKRIANGGATTATIQNLNVDTAATVKMTYSPSPEYVKAGGSNSVIVKENIPIGKGGSLLRNFRLTSGELSEPDLPLGWYGTLKVESDQPIQAYIAITNLNVNGDQLMAHLGFVK